MATQTATRPGAAKAGPLGAVGESEIADAETGGKKGKGKKGASGKKAKGGKKKLVILVVLVLVIGGVAYTMLGSKKAPSKAPVAPKPGAVVAMSDTTLNLTDGHFLKVKLGLQTIAGAPADLDTSKAADLLITEFTGQTMAAISTADGRNKLKADLLAKIEAAYPKEIMGIYFTEFVMQ